MLLFDTNNNEIIIAPYSDVITNLAKYSHTIKYLMYLSWLWNKTYYYYYFFPIVSTQLSSIEREFLRYWTQYLNKIFSPSY